jgi:hypothetical protein
MIAAAAVGGLILGTVGEARAQQPYNLPPFQQRPVYFPYSTPGLSPYLNLLRGGNPASNYYLGVLPELDRRANAIQFGNAITDLERRTALTAGALEEFEESLTATGHPAYFVNYGGFYNLGGYGRTGPLPGQGTSGTSTPRRGTTPPQ